MVVYAVWGWGGGSRTERRTSIVTAAKSLYNMCGPLAVVWPDTSENRA